MINYWILKFTFPHFIQLLHPTGLASLRRCVASLQQHITEVDKHYDSCNEAWAKGEVEDFASEPSLGLQLNIETIDESSLNHMQPKSIKYGMSTCLILGGIRWLNNAWRMPPLRPQLNLCWHDLATKVGTCVRHDVYDSMFYWWGAAKLQPVKTRSGPTHPTPWVSWNFTGHRMNSMD